MATFEEQLKQALEQLRADAKERKFDQTVDFIVNLQKYSLKKNPINAFVTIPHKAKDKKVAAFLDGNSDLIDTIPLADFKKYNDKKKLKTLVKKYDFFIAQGSIMPKVATTFGRVLGPAGKMPSPQLGIILNADEKTLDELKKKINTSVKIRAKESSIKLPVGKVSMADDDIVENIMSIYNEVLKHLPREKENIKNIEVKFTMSKPIKIQVR
jgi:large subunit ribosomal protein L1